MGSAGGWDVWCGGVVSWPTGQLDDEPLGTDRPANGGGNSALFKRRTLSSCGLFPPAQLGCPILLPDT